MAASGGALKKLIVAHAVTDRVNKYFGQGVTKRCRLSWLTNCALVYEPKCGGGCGGVSAKYSSAHGAQINFGVLTLYLSYDFDACPGIKERHHCRLYVGQRREQLSQD